MQLWTVQPYNVYETLTATGIYKCNPHLSSLLEEDSFINAYKWISNEMKNRIGNPSADITFPVWAWYRVDGKNRKPDMRTIGMRVFEESVLMEIEIQDNKVLLSDFDHWHLVLNDGIFYKASLLENISSEEWELETDKEDVYYENLSDQEKITYKENSWKNIFSPDIVSRSAYVQATFWELEKEQIKKVWKLKGYHQNKYML